MNTGGSSYVNDMPSYSEYQISRIDRTTADNDIVMELLFVENEHTPESISSYCSDYREDIAGALNYSTLNVKQNLGDIRSLQEQCKMDTVDRLEFMTEQIFVRDNLKKQKEMQMQEMQMQERFDKGGDSDVK